MEDNEHISSFYLEKREYYLPTQATKDFCYS
jgi:hypothetical protein